jgi:hypothetical protein
LKQIICAALAATVMFFATPQYAAAQNTLPVVEVIGDGWVSLCTNDGCSYFLQDGSTWIPDVAEFSDVGLGTPVGEGTTVDAANKTVNTDQINCTAEFGTPENFAALYWLAVPSASTGTVITLNGAAGSSWKFMLGNKTHRAVIRVAGGTCD